MKGENNYQLQWPFEHNVKYGIVNWKRYEKHITGTLSFKDAAAMSKTRVKKAERAPVGYGPSKPLSHASLYGSKDEHTKYLKEDCVCLQVLKVEPPK